MSRWWSPQVVFGVSIVALLMVWGVATSGVAPAPAGTASAPGVHATPPPVSAVPSSAAPSSAPGAFHTVGSSGGSTVGAPTDSARGSSGDRALTPHPQACPTPPYIPLGSNNLLPPYPSIANSSTIWADGASGCTEFYDTVHESFSSNLVGSGDQAQVPITLPQNPGGAESLLLNDVNVGMVVQGDLKSIGHQGWAEVYFMPDPSSNVWETYLAVWVATESSVWYTPPTMTTPASCGGTSEPVGWNDGNVYCVADDLNGGNGISVGTFPGGDTVDVAFSGTPGGGSGMVVYVNDTTTGDTSTFSQQLSGAATSDDWTFTPYFASACLDFCQLNWSGSFGFGVGVDLCDETTILLPPPPVCFSYNETAWNQSSPLYVGVPTFVQGTTFTGQYFVIAPQSLTGHCSGVVTTVPSVVPCSTESQLSGFYPSFTFNGTGLNFGGTWAWSVATWGGGFVEFGTYGGLTDDEPLFPANPTNNSDDGFIPSGDALTVTDRVAVYGNVTSVDLAYTLNGEPGGNLTMSLIAGGTTRDGNWTATIPATGGDGTIAFRVWAVDVAGASQPGPDFPAKASMVQRGALPTFDVTVLSTQPGCGGVVFNGTTYNANSVIATTPGFYPVVAFACYMFAFHNWWVTPGVQPPAGPSGTLGVSASATLQVNLSYVRQGYNVTFNSDPTSCSAVNVNGVQVTTPATLPLEGPATYLGIATYTLSTVTCGGYDFAGWTITNPVPDSPTVSILGGTFNITGNGTITENYLAVSSGPVALDFATVPTSCPGILFNGAGYVNNEAIDIAVSTPYPIHQDPCAHFGFSNFTVTGGLSISGGTLTATDGGIVTENNYHLTEVTLYTHPVGCGTVDWDGLDQPAGTVLNLTNHTVHTAFGEPCGGFYFIGFLTTGDISYLGNTFYVNGSGTVQANFLAGSPNVFVGFLTSPQSCGSIYFNNVQYNNSQYTHVGPGTVFSISATSCADYGFVSWSTNSGAVNGISIVGNTAYINQSGSITANFEPLVAIDFETSPSTCGAIELNGVDYHSGDSVNVPELNAYRVTGLPCNGYVFSSWGTSTGSDVSAGLLNVTGPTYLTAYFVQAHYSVTVLVGGVSCGSVQLNHIGYANNSTVLLLDGSYALAAVPCSGELLSGWNTTGGLSVANSTLTVNGTGNVTALYGFVPLSIALTGANSSYTDTEVLFGVNVAVPIPPYNYSYTWNFGDGSAVRTTPANFTSHSFASAGTYTVTVTVVDPAHRSASTSTKVVVTTPPPLQSLALSPLEIGALAGVVVLFAIAILLAQRRNRAPPGEGPDDSGTANAQELVDSSAPPPADETTANP